MMKLLVSAVFFAVLCAAAFADEARVDALLKQMTVDEMIGQLEQLDSKGLDPAVVAQIKGKSGLGSILNEINPNTVNALQKIAVEESRLHIPLVFARDVIHGFKTVFPIPLGQAAAWNPDIVRQGAKIAALEASSVGIRWTFAPMVDISRDNRWGRIAESLGEDPYLASVLAAAMVRGFQGENLKSPQSLAACVKHFAGYGAAEGGLDYNSTQISTEQLRNIYLPPFLASIQAGAATVMVSFNEINGVPNSANEYLLRKILREDWKYNGLAVSDWASVAELVPHGVAEDLADAAAKALSAGVDMDMEGHAYFPNLAKLYRDGKVKREHLTEAVRRVLQLKEQLGLFENPYIDTAKPSPFYAAEHLAAAKEAALQSAVLLKNKDNVLPLRKDIKSIAVIGPMADAPFDQLGTWVMDGEKEHTVTPLAALRRLAAEPVQINYAPGLKYSRDRERSGFIQAISAAQKSDVVLFFAGEEASLSGEAHSRADISLPGAQKDLFALIAQTGKPVVLVIMSGRAIEIRGEISNATAVLLSFHPGTMGGEALAELLFGKAVPTGKLPVSYPLSVGQTPIHYNHKNTGRPAQRTAQLEDLPLEAVQASQGNVSCYLDAGRDPLFPFGFGLSYTQYRYDNLTLSADKLPSGGSVTVGCTVTNTGERDGTEIVQFYVRDKVGVITRPVKELKGFKRTAIKAGAAQRIEFVLSADDLTYYDNADGKHNAQGELQVWIGPNSAEGVSGKLTAE
ncbi:MAG: beta-glucosidase BglX [Planctomycetaceae bacterium]|jgi:beta-glucosidase|nr:beta-glucosidase BglX [Planctomycetaceae bacterium]